MEQVLLVPKILEVIFKIVQVKILSMKKKSIFLRKMLKYMYNVIENC
jgi:hypothetical protein